MHREYSYWIRKRNFPLQEKENHFENTISELDFSVLLVSSLRWHKGPCFNNRIWAEGEVMTPVQRAVRDFMCIVQVRADRPAGPRVLLAAEQPHSAEDWEDTGFALNGTAKGWLRRNKWNKRNRRNLPALSCPFCRGVQKEGKSNSVILSPLFFKNFAQDSKKYCEWEIIKKKKYNSNCFSPLAITSASTANCD